MNAHYKEYTISFDAMSKKYAYYIGTEIGMKKNWIGKDIKDCHSQMGQKISLSIRNKMYSFFVSATDNIEIEQSSK